MAIASDPFGKSVFGGGTTLAMQGSGAAPTTAAVQPYKYAGQGWNDPLAQQMYSKYMGSSPVEAQELAARATRGATPGVNYQSPVDPTQWGGGSQGDRYNQMKAAYLAAGGQGTAEQLAGTYKTPDQQAAADALAKTGGSGSSFSLSPGVLQKMWR